MYNSTNSNYTEEAFLLSSLQEVVKVWARGFGQAKFDLNICDGVADLSLNFKLGHPSEPHCEPVHLHPHHSHPIIINRNMVRKLPTQIHIVRADLSVNVIVCELPSTELRQLQQLSFYPSQGTFYL